MHRHRNAAHLSLLAQGRGLVSGGVEIECFRDDRKAYTLNGEAFFKSSTSPEGQYSRPYRKCQLTLPKTYITRRGQMVLFTSPEDMVIGQSVALHRREGTTQTAATQLKTVPQLVSSSMAYQTQKPYPSAEVGHFTPVYLQRLREAAEKAKQAENYQAEKGEVDMEEGGDDLDAADSGLGMSLRPSSGRLSALSHLSCDETRISLPDGRLSELDEEDIAMEIVDPLKQLAGELSTLRGEKPLSKRKKTSDSQKTKAKTTKTKSRKRKKARKATKEDDSEGGTNLNTQEERVGENGVNDKNEMALVEQQRKKGLEMERKRKEKEREKAALEAQRATEAEERRRLKEELSELQKENKMRTVLGDRLDLLEPQTQLSSEPADVGETEGERERGKSRDQGKERRVKCHTKEGDIAQKREEQLKRKMKLESRRVTGRADEKGAKLKEKTNSKGLNELATNRFSQSISQSHTFSYFSYLPPKTGSASGAGQTKQGQKNKRKKNTR